MRDPMSSDEMRMKQQGSKPAVKTLFRMYLLGVFLVFIP